MQAISNSFLLLPSAKMVSGLKGILLAGSKQPLGFSKDLAGVTFIDTCVWECGHHGRAGESSLAFVGLDTHKSQSDGEIMVFSPIWRSTLLDLLLPFFV